MTFSLYWALTYNYYLMSTYYVSSTFYMFLYMKVGLIPPFIEEGEGGLHWPLSRVLIFWCPVRLENHSPHWREVYSLTCSPNKLIQCLLSLPTRWMPSMPSNPAQLAWLCAQSCPPAAWTPPRRHEKRSRYFPKELSGLSATATSLSQCDLSKNMA